MKKILATTAVAVAGGLAFAPVAQADDYKPTGDPDTTSWAKAICAALDANPTPETYARAVFVKGDWVYAGHYPDPAWATEHRLGVWSDGPRDAAFFYCTKYRDIIGQGQVLILDGKVRHE